MKQMNSRPDFSKVETLEMALELCAQGILEPLYLMPCEFGGGAVPENTVYVPAGMAEVKLRNDLEVIAPLIREGLVREYMALPSYAGRSLVPVSILVRAFDPREVSFEFAMWGRRLGRGRPGIKMTP